MTPAAAYDKGLIINIACPAGNLTPIKITLSPRNE